MGQTDGAARRRPRVVVLDDWNEAFGGAAPIERLRERVELTIHTDQAPSRDETLRRLAGAEIVVANRERTRFDAATFEALPDLRLIAQTGDGCLHIDLPAASRAGVLVSATPSGSRASMVELTIGLMIAAMRRFGEQDRALRAGRWTNYIGQALEGKTLGVVGVGRLGSRVGKVAQALGMRVIAAGIFLTPERAEEHGFEYRSLDELCSEADVISVHVRLTELTRGLIGASHLARMKPTAVLVNTARGPIVDEGALAGALRSRRIAGAALDVYGQEPLPPNHPLLSCETALLTAHTGWVTDNNYQRFVAGIAENITAYLDGQPQHVINPEARPELALTAFERH
jgi:phosphoglycerate dehydrogenase-like enzyme